ncbi:hypothetical protein C7N43_15035 [Sphingobacteriales bacterium UPWRP_1]|nr:hypothetical protein BVG80_04900 [Sphingobacteriales bacterium TSM_CSM]PSJ76234.1 hypothetical protein C7N43_15035 [Sphingobacteriales bacterium UPWRP_1]
MATRLTGFSKFLITLLIVGGIAAGFYYLANKTNIIPKNNGGTGTTNNTGNKGNTNNSDVIKVGVVTWGGYAGGQYFNEGFQASENSRYYKEYGLKVEFKVLDDFAASREAFKADEVNLLWATVDAFPTEVANLKEFEPQIVYQADWSRGGDAIVVRRGINTVADLKGKKIAVALMTPSHSFLLWLLEAGDLKPADVEIVEAPNAIDAAAYFKAGRVDAAVVWSPDDEDCVNSVKGSKVLKSTKSASNIIADIFIAKKAYAEENKDKLQKLFEGWMRGAAEINSNDANKRKAAKILSEGLNMPEDYCYKAINNVRLCTYGDNVNFFNLNGNYNGVKGEDLYNKMTKVYQNLGYAKNDVPAWRLVANPSFIRSTSSLTGKEHLAEESTDFTPATKEMETAPAFSSKKVTINFDSGSYMLSENAKQLIDIQFTDIAKAFGNARIRIEGNTDNVGNRDQNVALSKKRAQAVADYLVKEYNMDPNRFVVIGNGPDKPVADNSTPEGKAKNRRTDFNLLSEEGKN